MRWLMIVFLVSLGALLLAAAGLARHIRNHGRKQVKPRPSFDSAHDSDLEAEP
jgi:hypothetical protein